MAQQIPDCGVSFRFSTGKYSLWWPLLTFLLVMGMGRAAAEDTSPAPKLSPQQQQRLQERDPYAKEIERLRTEGKQYPQGHPELAQSLNRLGSLLEAQAEYGKAEPIYREALAMRRALYPKEKYPEGHPELAQSLNNLGYLLQAMGRYAEAERLYDEALTMRRALYPKEMYPQGHSELAQSLNNFGYLYRVQLAYSKAEPFYEQALAMRRALYPKEKYPQGHPDVVQSLLHLGTTVFRGQGKYSKAELLYREGLGMCRVLYPKEKYPQGHTQLATGLDCLGALFHAQGEYGKAEPCYREALAMRRALYPKQNNPRGHPDLFQSLSNLGDLLWREGKYSQAELLLREALELQRALHPKENNPTGHPDLALSLNNLGVLLQYQGEYGKAEPLYRDALAMWQTLYPKEKYPQGHPDLASSLNNLGTLLQYQREYGKAEPFLRDALAMWQMLYPKEKYPQGHPLLASGLNNMGNLLKDQGEYGKAEAFLREALAMDRALYPKEKYPQGHPQLASRLNNMGNLLREQGEYGKAEAFLRDALAMRRALYPEEKYALGHPDLATSLNGMGVVLEAQGEYAKAKRYYEQGLSMQLNLATLYADATSEIQGLNYLAQLPATRDRFLSLRYEPLQTPPDEVYAPIWRSSAALTRLLERRQQALFASHDPTTRRLTEELLSTRRQLARLLLASASNTKNHEQRLKDLSDRKEDLERQLAQRLPSSFLPLDQDAPPHTELVQRLPERTVFIDFLRYRRLAQDPKVRGRKGESYTASYVAFVLCTSQPVQRVELGAAQPIEDALADWRQAIARRLEDQAAARAETLRALVWEPLAAYLPDGSQTIYLAPEGALTRLPWAALPGKKGSVLLEEYTLAVVPHGPFLLRSLTTPAAESDPRADVLLTVCGVPYDQKPKPLAAVNEELLSMRSPALGPKGVHWPDLPGTQAEVDRILALAGPRRTRDLRGTAASTAQVEAELPKARWAHFATHGFFADASFRSALQLDEKLFAFAGIRDRGTVGARNPLVLSGLVFAGANLPPGEDQDPLTYDQGIATAETLTSLDLRRLELVVLSACETGLGDVAGGEGVFGLQRAFHLAGARTVIASLWKLDDHATQALMVEFYRNLWERKLSKLEALRQAQLTMLRDYDPKQGQLRGAGLRVPARDAAALAKAMEERRRQGGVLPPFYWAGFILSGDGR